MNKDQRHLSNLEIDERAAESQALLDNKVLNEALDSIYSKATEAMLNADVGSLTATQAHAMLKAIFEVRNQLKQNLNDQKMRQKYPKGDKPWQAE